MINYATDCSGMCAVSQALKDLGINSSYKFASEIDKYARKTLLENHSPEVLFEDITMPRVLPKLDLYVAGFPCQPFSLAGNRKSDNDPRGQIFYYVLDTIKKTDPNYFILENVSSIRSTSFFGVLQSKLSELADYNIDYTVYNTKDYGLPQNRPRLYIVGVKKYIGNYKVPSKVPMKPIGEILTISDAYNEFPPYILLRMETLKDTTIINANVQRVGSVITNKTICNTLTAHGDFWCIKNHRKANIIELLRLQGFPDNFKQVVSDTQLKKQIGNSMSVCVIKAIINSLITTTLS